FPSKTFCHRLSTVIIPYFCLGLTDALTHSLTDALTHSTYRCAETGHRKLRADNFILIFAFHCADR
ncbi:MAG: hypothetical protein IKK74_01945, partial [Clostridia bacterium]|nr:hypothetical protein [Clostridia bacterium]